MSDVHAEESVLAACMTEAFVCTLRPEDFEDVEHQMIYSALVEAGIGSADEVDVCRVLKARNQGHLIAETHRIAGDGFCVNASHWAELIEREARERRYQDSVTGALVELGDEYREPDAVMGVVLNAVDGMRPEGGSLRSLRELSREEFDLIERRHSGEEEVRAVRTGFEALDEYLVWRPGELTVLAARPAMGKTALGIAMAVNFARRMGEKVVFYSLEMTGGQLMQRVLCLEASVPLVRIRGKLKDSDFPKLAGVMNAVSGYPLSVDDSPIRTVGELRSQTRQAGGVGLVIVDYLQLLRGDERSERRDLEVAEISRGLKALAKESDCAVLALSQLNRGVEAREDKRPRLSDLRESGAIEQDADCVAFVYRDDYYSPDSEERGTAEIIVGKNRNGPTGMARLGWDPERTRFHSLGVGK